MTLLLFIEIVGTISFAISGVMVGLSKKMDAFGIIVLGITTATGGGVIRDLILGNTPPLLFRNPLYAAVALITSIVVMIPVVRRFFLREKKIYDIMMLILDSFGLGVFTVVGIKIAVDFYPKANLFLLSFVGVISGVGGSVTRDVLAGNTPYIFVKHFYACASIIGAIIAGALWNVAGEEIAMLAGAVIIITLRFLAARYRWSLPIPKE